MSLQTIEVGVDQAPLVHHIMIEAFSEYPQNSALPFAAHYETVEDVAHAIQMGGAVVAHMDEIAVGSARYAFAWDRFVIERVAVLPYSRGIGAARAMMQHLEGIAYALGYTRIELCSRVTLPQNINFYRKLGYEIDHTSPDRMRVTLCKALHQDMFITA
jgi:ribosomal protein S18 acetylase RimI-like enzyme